MKNQKQKAQWTDNPIIYPNEMLDEIGNENIKMAATMIGMELRESNPGIILDIIAGIAKEIETHWNGWNTENKFQLDIRRLRAEENQVKISVDKVRRSEKYYIDGYTSYPTLQRNLCHA